MYLHSFLFFLFFFFAPVTLRDGGVCTLCRAFISRPEGRRNITSAKSSYSGSRLPVWSCASLKQMAARFLPKPPRLQDGRPSASQPPSLSIPGIVRHRWGSVPSQLRRAASAQCRFSLRKTPPPPTSPVTERLTPPSV